MVLCTWLYNRAYLNYILPMETLAYLRISSRSQNLERQRELIASFNPARIFEDIVTGKIVHRPALGELVTYCRAGDRIIVPSIDRLGRSLADLNSILTTITGKGASVYFIKENMEFSTDQGDPIKSFMFNMLAAFAQFEREIIKDRQREGIAIAKKEGKYKGRPLDENKHKKILALHAQGVSRRAIALVHKVASYPTVSKVLKQTKRGVKNDKID
jgi:DNA invertase Pin-like site-specific DNA recombinase